jgi:hypothetical protein
LDSQGVAREDRQVFGVGQARKLLLGFRESPTGGTSSVGKPLSKGFIVEGIKDGFQAKQRYEASDVW